MIAARDPCDLEKRGTRCLSAQYIHEECLIIINHTLMKALSFLMRSFPINHHFFSYFFFSWRDFLFSRVVVAVTLYTANCCSAAAGEMAIKMILVTGVDSSQWIDGWMVVVVVGLCGTWHLYWEENRIKSEQVLTTVPISQVV